MNRKIITLAFGVIIAGAGACGRNNGKASDATLGTDLSLAAQQRGYDSVAAAEHGTAPNGLRGTTPGTAVHHTASTGEVYHPRSSGSSVGTSPGTVTTTTTSSGTVVKHTQRDAAIGAAAGAIIGATTSKSKVKGGVIGGVVGGILGGVIGNNVDKTKKP